MRLPIPRGAAPLARKLFLALLAGLVLVFALIGVLHTFRGTPVSDVEAVGAPRERIAVDDPRFAREMELFTGTSLAPGHRVEILLDGATYPRLWRDLRAARRSITLRLYYAEPGAVADSLRAVLSERARAGVPVLLLLDAVGSALPEEYRESLRAAGVQVRVFRPIRWYTLNRAQNRSHVRAVVIDGRVGYTGGFGVADKWLGGGRRPGEWRETNARFTGPAVRQLQAAFAVGWAEATGVLLTGPLFFPPEERAGPDGARGGLLYAVPTLGSTAAERFLTLTLAGATRTLFVTNAYFVPDDDLRRLLRQAAARGVDVRVLTAGRHTDVPAARFAGRAHYEALLEAGVRIYEYRPSMLHAKSLVVDGQWASVGTMNFDNRSTALNEESNLLVLDAAVGARLDSIFLRDLRLADPVRLEDFRRRPWTQRVREWYSTLLTRLL